MSHLKTELIDTEKLLDTPQQISVFVDTKYQILFDEIVKECNIQIIKEDTYDDLMGIGIYTLQLANADEVYWFGRNYQNAINKYHKKQERMYAETDKDGNIIIQQITKEEASWLDDSICCYLAGTPANNRSDIDKKMMVLKRQLEKLY